MIVKDGIGIIKNLKITPKNHNAASLFQISPNTLGMGRFETVSLETEEIHISLPWSGEVIAILFDP